MCHHGILGGRAHLSPQHGFKRLRRYRAAIEVALELVATTGLEKVQLCAGFYAFGNGAQAQAVGQRDDGVHNRFVLVVHREALHKGLVYLELVNLKSLEVAQRGITGAKVVDRERHSQCLEAGNLVHREARVLHGHAFGEFELQQG